jgi:hypothetical protein
MAGFLNKIHSTPSEKSTVLLIKGCVQKLTLLAVPAIVESVGPILHSCQENTTALASLIPENQFWRWKENWSVTLRNAIFSAVLVEYLTSRHLATLPHVAEILGSKWPFESS